MKRSIGSQIKSTHNNARNEVEAMDIIIAIQGMQKIIYGSCYEYKQFNGNTCDELRVLRDGLIPLYNDKVRSLNK